MMNRNLRKAFVVTATITTAGLLMTACQNDSSSSSGSSSSKSSKTSQSSGTSKSSGQQDSSSGQQDSADSAAVANDTSDSKSGVSGTFKNGTVSYLAPGKYMVKVPGKVQQAFFTAENTLVYGAGQVCGSPRSEARPQCTLDELETATKKKAVTADVTMKDGIATVVRERHDAQNGITDGVNGTWLGNVSYLAPGKYTVSGMKGVEQAFYIADDTLVYGAGTICGSPGSAEMSLCTPAELEAAAKKGVSAKVRITDGVATSITEDR
ncbi:lipoprotein [Streptomyces pseudoechinosporeus]